MASEAQEADSLKPRQLNDADLRVLMAALLAVDGPSPTPKPPVKFEKVKYHVN